MHPSLLETCMKKTLAQERQWAVQRHLNGESSESICISLARTRPWLYKWVDRYDPDNPAWCQERSRPPLVHRPGYIDG